MTEVGPLADSPLSMLKMRKSPVALRAESKHLGQDSFALSVWSLQRPRKMPENESSAIRYEYALSLKFNWSAFSNSLLRRNFARKWRLNNLSISKPLLPDDLSQRGELGVVKPRTEQISSE